MMTQQLGFSILSAPLAAMDRRALSQAWLSVLHEHVSNSRDSQRRVGAERALPPSGRTRIEIHSKQREIVEHAIARAVDRRDRPRGGDVATCDRRASRSPLAREIERAFLRPAQTLRSSFTLAGGTRVHVQLAGSGEQLRLVAVCPPTERATVSEALAQARYALARRGIVLHTEVR